MFPYETEIVITLKEVTKTVNSCFFRMGGILPIGTALLVVLCVICRLSGQREISAELFIGAVMLPIVTYLISILKTRHAYRTNRIAQNAVIRYMFYDTYFRVDIPNGHTDISYEDLYRVIETKDRFYLFINNTNMYIVDKTKCSKDLIKLIQHIARGFPRLHRR